MILRRLLSVAFGLKSVATPQISQACSTCFGDPQSPMAQGAVAGVWVLVGFIGFVLLGIVGTGLFWIHRGRRLQMQTDSITATNP